MEDILANGKYAVLFHQGKGADHFDLLLEGQSLCPTFQFDNKELDSGLRIQDHRKKYLAFEGLISKEKGIVSIVELGTYLFSKNLLVLVSAKYSHTLSLNKERNIIKKNGASLN